MSVQRLHIFALALLPSFFVSQPMLADEGLAFGPDRPGVGDSTLAAPVGMALVEAGIDLATAEPSALSAPALTLRLGIAERVELRFGVPSVSVGIDDASSFLLSGPGVGAKFTGEVGSALSWSVIPGVQLSPLEGVGATTASLGLNGVFSQGPWSIWLNAIPSYGGGQAAVSGGGGVAASVGPGGLYANGGHDGAAPFVGAGGWLQLREGVQLDAGVDVGMGVVASPIIRLGASFIAGQR